MPAGSLFQAGISDISSAVSSYYSGKTDEALATESRYKAQGDVLEGQAYGEAAGLAGLNAKYTAASTNRLGPVRYGAVRMSAFRPIPTGS